MGKLSELLNKAIESFYKNTQTLWEHLEDKENPHKVTKEQVGLGNVSNTAAATQVEFNLHETKAALAHPDKSVTTAKLADKAVSTAKLADSSVSTGKISAGAVTADKIADKALTTAKIADGAVTAVKIGGTVPIEKGGTGAADAKGARTALGAMSAEEGNNLAGNATNIKNTYGGFSAGEGAGAGEGAAVGRFAVAGFGFAGGYRAHTTIDGFPIDAVQLGTGTNQNPMTLQVYDKQLLDEWGSIPLERLKNAALLKRYGVRFAGSANSGDSVTRLYDAEGLVAQVAEDGDNPINNFDYIYPWSGRRRCCGFFDESGNFVVNAYEDEPGYTTDGTGGEVWVETPLFYYLHEYGDDGSEEISISPYPISGYKPSPIHINADGTLRQKAYTAAYPMGMADGLPTSRSGVFPVESSVNSGIENARKLGENYTVTTAAEHYTRCLLMWVEFATRNVQSVMRGCCSLPFSIRHTVTAAQESANTVIIPTEYAGGYIKGQYIGIGTSMGVPNKAAWRMVEAIASYDDSNSAITFSGNPVSTAVGNYVFSQQWITGTCDDVHFKASSGSAFSDTSGKYTCIYRGEESPFANAYECISDILFKRGGSGTADDPYTYDVYYLPDAAKYNGGAITDDYVKIDYQMSQTAGFVKKLGCDERYPFVRVPLEVGASAGTYYCDYYVRPNYSISGAAVGGFYGENDYAGVSGWYCPSVPGGSNSYRNARLSYCQKNRR